MATARKKHQSKMSMKSGIIISSEENRNGGERRREIGS